MQIFQLGIDNQHPCQYNMSHMYARTKPRKDVVSGDDRHSKKYYRADNFLSDHENSFPCAAGHGERHCPHALLGGPDCLAGYCLCYRRNHPRQLSGGRGRPKGFQTGTAAPNLSRLWLHRPTGAGLRLFICGWLPHHRPALCVPPHMQRKREAGRPARPPSLPGLSDAGAAVGGLCAVYGGRAVLQRL